MNFDGRISVKSDVFETKKIRLLACYIAKQLDSNFPLEGVGADVDNIMRVLPVALARLRPILKNVLCFNSDNFYIYNSLQYATFLYLLANEQAKLDTNTVIADRLFCLNKTLNSIEIFYNVELPEIFFISHGIGAVLGNSKYGNRFVFFQNVTVGRINNSKPVIGDDVILYPGVTVTGKTIIGNNCVISAGINLHNEIIPDNTIVKERNGEKVLMENKRNFIDHYLLPKQQAQPRVENS
jgi:serine O-acetyltransferase